MIYMQRALRLPVRVWKNIQWERKRQVVESELACFPRPYKLHLGCGPVQFDGWVNMDLNKALSCADIEWDLNNGIPFPDASCLFLYSEHLFEHFAVEAGVRLMRECYRVLAPGGVMRIAMPSLDFLIEQACNGHWRDQDWLNWPQYKFIRTRAEMLNIVFRWWGHQWIYDQEELRRRLREAGFQKIRTPGWGASEIPELRDRETRKDSMLICEAEK
ncbi:MAG: methyltransferase domain-containing protein [Anaerolineae bacterium]